MKKVRAQAPPARLTLRAHPPALARVVLVYQPLPGRLLRTLASLAFFWGIIPLLLWVPPHVPWVIGAFVTGLYLAHRYWTGRYLVCAFAGVCPRCGWALDLDLGSTIDLPHTLTCFHCHFEPRLEIVRHSTGALSAPADRIEHRTGDCVGRWILHEFGKDRSVVCDRCLARYPATTAIRSAAEAENERGDLLLQLTGEGRSGV